MNVFVVKNKQFLGTLIEDSAKIKFIYSDEISVDSYLHGLKEKENISSALFPIFENMLPEFEQVNFIKAQNNITTEIEVLLYLSDIHGSYEFYTQDQFEKLELKEQNSFVFNDVKEEILDSTPPPRLCKPIMLSTTPKTILAIMLKSTKYQNCGRFARPLNCAKFRNTSL